MGVMRNGIGIMLVFVVFILSHLYMQLRSISSSANQVLDVRKIPGRILGDAFRMI